MYAPYYTVAYANPYLKVKANKWIYDKVKVESTIKLDVGKLAPYLINTMRLTLKRGYAADRSESCTTLRILMEYSEFDHLRLSSVTSAHLDLWLPPEQAGRVRDEIMAYGILNEMPWAQRSRYYSLEHRGDGNIHCWKGGAAPGWAKIIKPYVKDIFAEQQLAFKEVWKFIQTKPVIKVKF